MRYLLVGILIMILASPMVLAQGFGTTAGAAAVAIAATSPATDGGFWNFLSAVPLAIVGGIVSFLTFIVGFIGAIFFTFAGVLLQFGLLLNNTLLDPKDPAHNIVYIGWRIMRDVANLGFVISMIIIAFATMLRVQSYGMKQTLVRLIIAAVLVNFSLAIAGALVDASNLVTNFLVVKTIGGSYGSLTDVQRYDRFALELGGAFNPQSLLEINQENKAGFQAAGEDLTKMIVLIANFFFITFFTIVAALAMLAIATMVLWRYVVLSILLVLLPLMLVFWVFPAGQKYWGEWSSKFIGQLLFLPISIFFLFLAVQMMRIKTDLQTSLATNPGSAAELIINQGGDTGQALNKFLNFMARPFQGAAQMVVVLFFLFFSLYIAKRLGGMGAESVINAATGLRKWAVGYVTGAPGRGARRLLSLGGPEKGLGARIATGMSRVPFLRRYAGGFMGFVGGSQAELDRRAKEFEALPTAARLVQARSLGIRTDPVAMAAMAKVLAKEGEFGVSDEEAAKGRGLRQSELAPFLSAAKRLGQTKEILKIMPQLALELEDWDRTKTGDELVQEQRRVWDKVVGRLRANDMEFINHEALKNPEIIFRLGKEHITGLGKKGDLKRKRELITFLSQAVDNTDYSPNQRNKFTQLAGLIQNANFSGVADDKMTELRRKVRKEPKGFLGGLPVTTGPVAHTGYEAGPPPEEEPPPPTGPTGGAPPAGGAPPTAPPPSSPAGPIGPPPSPTPSLPAGGPPTPRPPGPLTSQITRLRTRRLAGGPLPGGPSPAAPSPAPILSQDENPPLPESSSPAPIEPSPHVPPDSNPMPRFIPRIHLDRNRPLPPLADEPSPGATPSVTDRPPPLPDENIAPTTPPLPPDAPEWTEANELGEGRREFRRDSNRGQPLPPAPPPESPPWDQSNRLEED